MDTVFQNLSEIIKAIPESPIVVSLLAIAILATLAYLLFAKDQSKGRLVVFMAVFASVVALLFLLLVSWKSISPSTFYKIPKDSNYASFNIYTDTKTLEDCQSLATDALKSVGYTESEITVGGSNISAGGYFSTGEGIRTALWCSPFFDRQQLFGFTYGFDRNLIVSTSTKLYERLDSKIADGVLRDFGNLKSAYFKVQNSDLFLGKSIESCIDRVRQKLHLLGLPEPKRGGDVVYSEIKNGTFAVGCKGLSIDLAGDVIESGGLPTVITYVAFGADKAAVDGVMERFASSLSDVYLTRD